MEAERFCILGYLGLFLVDICWNESVNQRKQTLKKILVSSPSRSKVVFILSNVELILYWESELRRNVIGVKEFFPSVIDFGLNDYEEMLNEFYLISVKRN